MSNKPNKHEEKTHDLSVEYWMSRFPEATDNKKRKGGDFFIKHEGGKVWFEVYCREQPVTRCLRDTRGREKIEKYPLPDGKMGEVTTYPIIMCNPEEHLVEFIEQVFANDKKLKQFENPGHKKILVIDLTDGYCTHREIHGFNELYKNEYSVPAGCSGIAVVVRNTSPDPSFFIPNKNAEHSLSESEIKNIESCLLDKH